MVVILLVLYVCRPVSVHPTFQLGCWRSHGLALIPRLSSRMVAAWDDVGQDLWAASFSKGGPRISPTPPTWVYSVSGSQPLSIVLWQWRELVVWHSGPECGGGCWVTRVHEVVEVGLSSLTAAVKLGHMPSFSPGICHAPWVACPCAMMYATYPCFSLFAAAAAQAESRNMCVNRCV
jgi:hypothetical protein